MGAPNVPVTILGGSDGRPGQLPAESGLHPLAMYKGLGIRVGGRPLVAHLVERLRAAGFGPLAIAGPARAYGALELDAELIDTDGSVADNLRAAVLHHGARPEPLGVLACDVLPSVAELRELRALYEREAPVALWLPFVRVPSDASALGAFAWKPKYHIAPAPGAPPERILPGHLALLHPSALRLPLLYRLLSAAYATRNRSVDVRRRAMLRETLLALLGADLRDVARLRAPTLTATVLASGLRLARLLRRRSLERGELERLIGRIFERRDAAVRGIRFPFCEIVSLAEDIDTEEEARAIGGAIAGGGLA
jgi:hypothetical protein